MGYDQKLCDYLVKRFDIHCHNLLLDVGCGSGKHVRGFERSGIDARGIDKKECDLEKDPLPFPNNTFDVVFCKSVLEHIKNYGHVITEMERVLKPDGLMIIMIPQRNHLFFTYPEHISYPAFPYFREEFHQLPFYQFPWVWKQPWLKIIPKLIAWLIPDKYRFRKDGTQRVLIRHSKEPMWLLWARK